MPHPPDPFPDPPPIRLELTEEQVAAIEDAKPAGESVLVVGYSQRHRWPDNGRVSLVAWFRPLKATEKALVAAGIMAKGRTAAKRKRSQD